MTRQNRTRAVAVIAAVSTLATVLDATMAAAQQGPGGYPDNRYQQNGPGGYGGGDQNAHANDPYPNDRYPNNDRYQNGDRNPNNDRYQQNDRGSQYQNEARRPGDPAPPRGEYAPPPQGYDRPGAVYDDRAQRYDRDYADRYSRWAADYCVDRRNDNTASGAVIGGVLGAIVGSGMAGRHDRGGGALLGGVLGAGAGAAIGSVSGGREGGCPPGYYVRSGAPAFAYGGGGYGVVVGPSWYNPWIWYSGRWVYRPYRYWYFNNGGAYWRPGWRPGHYEYHYRRW